MNVYFHRYICTRQEVSHQLRYKLDTAEKHRGRIINVYLNAIQMPGGSTEGTICLAGQRDRIAQDRDRRFPSSTRLRTKLIATLVQKL